MRAADDDDVPQYDPKGTRYNAMALPSSMRQEAEQFNARTGKNAMGGGAWKQSGAAARASVAAALSSDGVGVGIGGSGGGGAATSTAPASKPKPKSSGVLLPPQLRRPNITTEDTSSMRTAKRPKPGPSQ